MADPAGEKRKADSDAEEEVVSQGSPMRSRLEDDEDMLSRVTAFDVLQLHSVSSLATDSEKLGIETMNLEHWDIDGAVNRGRITQWVREKKPAFTIGNPKNKTLGHIRIICGLYHLQVREGRWFVHEQPTNASAWKLKEVANLKKVEGMFDSGFGPGIHALNFGLSVLPMVWITVGPK